jgi:hypothetical protein
MANEEEGVWTLRMAGAEDMAKRGLMVIVSQVKMFCGCQW